MPTSIRNVRGGSVQRSDGRSSRPVTFQADGRIKSGTPEASDLVALPKGRFLTVSDTQDSVRIVDKDGNVQKLKLEGLPDGHSQLEGVAYDRLKNNLFVVREETKELLRYEWNGDADRQPKLEKRFRIDINNTGHGSNKGVEGITYLPGDVSPTGTPQLLLAHEGRPRKLFMVAENGTGKPKEIELENQVRDVLRDFSAVAVDPLSGNIFLSSDASSTVAQVSLDKKGDGFIGRLVNSFPLRDGDNELKRVEGLTFDKQGDLYVLTENDGVLHRLKRD